MKIERNSSAGFNAFTAYGADYVAVNGQIYRGNVAVLPGQIIPEWSQAGFATLSQADFTCLAGLAPEIVLIGVGAELRFPAPELLQPLMAARIGFEAMNTPAVCRTYNILANEGRRVVAAIIAGD